MKKIYFQLLFLAGLILIGLIIGINEAMAQTIRIANNNPDATPGVNVYTGSSALQDAVAAAVSGDIIYVSPSLNDYGTITITDKQLTIYGVGLQPEMDNSMRSEMGSVYINGALSSGTRLSGIDMTALHLADDTNPVHELSDITIDNSILIYVEGPSGSNKLSDILVRNCIINSGGQTGAFYFSPNVENILITNNIMRTTCCGYSAISGSGLIFQNNFLYHTGNGWTFSTFHNNTMRNNILYGTGLSITDGTTYTVFRNNLLFDVTEPAFPTETEDEYHNTFYDNIFGDPLFVNFSGNTALGWNFEWDISLQPGSPAIGAGTDGTDLGPGGGPYPFDYEGTFLPLVQELIVPGVISAGQDLQITIKAKGN